MSYYSPYPLSQLMLSLSCADISEWILDIFVFHLFIVNSEHMTIENKYRLSHISQQYWSCKVSSVSYMNTIIIHLVSSVW